MSDPFNLQEALREECVTAINETDLFDIYNCRFILVDGNRVSRIGNVDPIIKLG